MTLTRTTSINSPISEGSNTTNRNSGGLGIIGKCLAKGGKWDYKNKVCIMPNKKEETNQTQEEEQKKPNLNKKITFNKDKSVIYEIGGKQYHLSQEEYKTLQDRSKGGKITPQIISIREQEKINQEARKQIAEREKAELQEKGRALAFPKEVAQEQKLQQEVSSIEKPQLQQLDLEPKTAIIGGLETGLNPLTTRLIDWSLTQKPSHPEWEKAINLMKEGKINKLEREGIIKNQIQRKIFEDGLTTSEEIGALVEGIPVIGGLVAEYASDLIETPRGNLNTLVKTIRTERGRATKFETWAVQGIMNPDEAVDIINNIDQNILNMQARIKLLAINSPTLTFNADQINKIELEILRTREVIFAARKKASQGAIQDPDELALYLATQNMNEEVSNGI